MIEDQLDKEQRIRLEALSQATANAMGQRKSVYALIDDAKILAGYITNAGEEDA